MLFNTFTFVFRLDKTEMIPIESSRRRTKRDKFKLKWTSFETITGISSLRQHLHEVATSDNGLIRVNCLIEATGRVVRSLKKYNKSCLPTDLSITLKIKELYSDSLWTYVAESTDDFYRILMADRFYQSENKFDCNDFLNDDEDAYKEPILGDCCKVPCGEVCDSNGVRPTLCGSSVKFQCSERRRVCQGLYFCGLCAEHPTHYSRLFSEDHQNEENECMMRWHEAKQVGSISP